MPYRVWTADGRALYYRYKYLCNNYIKSQYFFIRKYVTADDQFVNEWGRLPDRVKLYGVEVTGQAFLKV